MAEESKDLDARDTLLDYYSTACTVHVGYIISLAIGVFAFFQLNSEIWLHARYPEIVASLVLSLFIVLGTYLTVRLIYWGILASLTIRTLEITVQDADKILDKKLDKANLLMRLHLACSKRFQEEHMFLGFFVGAERRISCHFLLYLGIYLGVSLLIYLVIHQNIL